MHSHFFLITVLVIWLNIVHHCQPAFAQGTVASKCEDQDDCRTGLSCLAVVENNPYSLNAAVRPPKACEGSGEDLCICMKPRIVDEKCDSKSQCNLDDTCEDEGDCEDNKFCFEYDESESKLVAERCGDSLKCVCAIPNDILFDPCSDSDECQDGERCAQLEEVYAYNCVSCDLPSELHGTIIKYSEETVPDKCESSVGSTNPPVRNDTATATETPDPSSPARSSAPNPSSQSNDATGNSDSDVCISVDSLSSFAAHQLVFSMHRRASVLCDASGSCATAGHMVTYQGSPMTMMSYCAVKAIGGCRKMTRFVNSPRMKPGLRVASNTDGLEFTALASRYSTKTEEWGLSLLVRLGA